MPKRKGKNNKVSSTDDVDPLDVASIVSLASDGSDAPTVSSLEVEDEYNLQSVLDKVYSAIDSLEEKRTETRVQALRCLINAFRQHYFCFDGTWNYVDTVLNGIENVIKRGKIVDQTLAAEFLSTFCLQFSSDEIRHCLAKFLPILEPVVRDSTVNRVFRAASATALSVLQSLSGYCDFVSPLEVMKSLETIFNISGLRGGSKPHMFDAEATALHLSALRGWTLIYTFLTPFDACSTGKTILPVLLNLLQGASVDLRMTAGETSAIIYERIRSESDTYFKGPYYGELVSLLGELATDCSKSRSKLDLKKQRHCFRDLVEAVVHYDYPETSIDLGHEVISLASCVAHFHYEFLCAILGSGLRRQLRENIQVRDVFGLGPPIAHPKSMDRRAARDQRKLNNLSASKHRTQKLNIFRDKRSGMMSELN